MDYRAAGSGGEIPAEARAAFSDGARAVWAAVIGLGVMIPLDQRDLALSFEVTNHIIAAPLGELAIGSRAAGDPALDLNPEGVDGGDRFTSNLRLNVGFALPIRLAR